MHVAGFAILAFTCLAWFLAVAWLWKSVTALRGMTSLPDLTRLAPETLPKLEAGAQPHLSVIVPACNEENSIQATLHSLLASTGIRLEIIAVDDRSTDGTGALMEEVAAEAALQDSPHTLRVIRNRALPPGWLGKPHALHLAAQCAVAPWLLFTDADLTFAPRALELALRHALAVQADHLVLTPTLIRKGMGEAVMQAMLQAPLAWFVRLWKVADPRAKDFIGVGGFSMVRAEAYTRLGGFAGLRMEVIEDMSFGCMVKRAGYRSSVALGPGLVSIHWIKGVFGIVGNVEKNGFAACRYSLAMATAVSMGLATLVLVPSAAIVLGGWTLPAGLLTYLGIALAMRANRSLNGISPLAALLYAPAAAIVWYAFVRSVALTLARRGVLWRGTRYPLGELRRNVIRWW